MRSNRMWLPLALTFTFAGCADNAGPLVPPAMRAAHVLVNPDRLPPPERFQWEIGEQLEAFGGVFADSSGDLVTLTTALADTNALRAAVRARMATSNSTAKSPDGRERPMRMRQARFTYRSLLSWKNALSMSDVSGIVDGIGVVESKNRILVLVRKPGSVALIRQSARTLGIPHDALVIGGTRAEPTQNIETGYFRPTIGGIRIEVGGGGCTLWGNAVVNGVRYGITNSHCTSVMGTVTGDAVTQGGGYIGYEAIDPPWNVQERHPDCISGVAACRFSDAAAFIYDEGAASEKTMARISGSPCGYACWGPMTAIAPNRIISWVVDYPWDGEIVDKVGSRTGWSRGLVEGSCFDIRIDVGGAYRRYLCTVRVVTSAHYGDSGSPVFFMYGEYARPTGILWGRDICRNTFPNLDDGSCPAPGYVDVSYPANAMYMNAWWAIRQELGFPDESVAFGF